MQSKPCSACAEVKPLDSFAVQRKGKLGRQAKCKACSRLAYYEPNKEKVLQATRARRSTTEGREQEAKWQRERRRNEPIKRILQEAKTRASKRGLQFSIDASDLSMPEVCPVLGIPVGMGYGARTDNSPSIDRVDSTKGYVKGNVRIISWRANRLKNDATLSELRAIVRYLESELSGEANAARIAQLSALHVEQKEVPHGAALQA